MSKLSINDLKDFRNQCVLVRVDYNVPLDENGAITDDKRIKATVPTLDFLVKGGAKVILATATSGAAKKPAKPSIHAKAIEA